jgi:uncharacterized membrane protein YeaQ/YmgE (transglycosylase-associated protein family)
MNTFLRDLIGYSILLAVGGAVVWLVLWSQARRDK